MKSEGQKARSERKSFVLSTINLLVSVNRSCIHVLAVSFNGGTSVQRGILNEIPYALEVVHLPRESEKYSQVYTNEQNRAFLLHFYSECNFQP